MFQIKSKYYYGAGMFVNKTAEALEIHRKDVKEVVDTYFKELIRDMKMNGKAHIRNFGTIYVCNDDAQEIGERFGEVFESRPVFYFMFRPALNVRKMLQEHRHLFRVCSSSFSWIKKARKPYWKKNKKKTLDMEGKKAIIPIEFTIKGDNRRRIDRISNILDCPRKDILQIMQTYFTFILLHLDYYGEANIPHFCKFGVKVQANSYETEAVMEKYIGIRVSSKIKTEMEGLMDVGWLEMATRREQLRSRASIEDMVHPLYKGGE